MLLCVRLILFTQVMGDYLARSRLNYNCWIIRHQALQRDPFYSPRMAEIQAPHPSGLFGLSLLDQFGFNDGH